MPINTSQVVDTALAAAVGYKHLQNQAEGNLLSAINAKSQSDINVFNAQQDVTGAEQKIKEFDQENPDLVENALKATGDKKQAEESWLEAEDDLTRTQKVLEEADGVSQPRDPKTGKYIKKEEYLKPFKEDVSNAETTAQTKFDEFDAIEKSYNELKTKVGARQELLNNVETQKEILQQRVNQQTLAGQHLARTVNKTKWLTGAKVVTGGKK